MLTSFDKDLLNLLQTNLPIDKRPFAVLAEKLHSDEDTVLSRVQELKQEGYLRRIGPFFDSAKLGYKGTLVALKVHPSKLKDVAQVINSYAGATHNYEREGVYNLWFTLLTPSQEMCEKTLRYIRTLPGVEAMMDLVSQKKYKINVQFKLK